MKAWGRPKNERTSLVHHLYITCTSLVHHLYILNNIKDLYTLYNTPNMGTAKAVYPPQKKGYKKQFYKNTSAT